LSRARCIVFDLDGPIAGVFSGVPAEFLARELLGVAERNGCLVGPLRDCDDPIAVLLGHTGEMNRQAGQAGHGDWEKTVAEMHDQLDTWERKAAESAEPTPGAADFIRACHASGKVLSLATNNHVDAATRILERQSVLDCFGGPVIGRPRDATRMKPDPQSLRRAMAPGIPPELHLMIGDSPTDYEAARAASMPFFGYHRSEAGRRRLREAGVNAGSIAARMTEFLRAVRVGAPGTELS
jgi:phosphoglycolate phosphatase